MSEGMKRDLVKTVVVAGLWLTGAACWACGGWGFGVLFYALALNTQILWNGE